MTGMSIVGKMSIGVLRIDSPPPNAIKSAITTNVYGLPSAVRISHIEGYQCAPDPARRLAAQQFAKDYSLIAVSSVVWPMNLTIFMRGRGTARLVGGVPSETNA